VIFDNIMSLIGGEMKDEEPWRNTLPWQHALTKRRIGQIWVHHTGHDKTKSYGTSTREWQLDTVIQLEAGKREGTDVVFRIHFQKARLRRPDTRQDFKDAIIALDNNRWELIEDDRIGKKQEPSPMGKKFLQVLVNCPTVTVGGKTKIDMETWRRECVQMNLIDPKEKPDAARSLFSKQGLRRPRPLQAASLSTSGWMNTWWLLSPLRRVIVGAHCLTLVDSTSRSAPAAPQCWRDCGP
jgi:hypothetical protein